MDTVPSYGLAQFGERSSSTRCTLVALVAAMGVWAGGCIDDASQNSLEDPDSADIATFVDATRTHTSALQRPADAKWLIEAPSGAQEFGRSVATGWQLFGDDPNSDSVVVGAPRSAEAFIFELEATNPSPSPSWRASPGDALFGFHVRVGNVHYNGRDDIIAAHHATGTSIYHGSESGPSTTRDWLVTDSQSGENRGRAVAVGHKLSGGLGSVYASDLAIGAYRYDARGLSNAGRVYVHYYQPRDDANPSGYLPESPSWTMDGEMEQAHFGNALASGDFNGDGFGDLAVGSDTLEGAGLAGGRVYVFTGGTDGLPEGDAATASAWHYSPFRAEARFGRELAADDINGDSRDDLIVGAYWYSDVREWGGALGAPGAAFLFLGNNSDTPLSTQPDWKATLSDLYTGSSMGWAVAIVPDQTGDGVPDIAVGAPGWKEDRGLVLVYDGTELHTQACPYWYAEGGSTGDRFGSALASVTAPASGGSTEHLAVGAPRAGGGGAVYIYEHLAEKSNMCSDNDGDGYVFNPTGIESCCEAEPDCDDRDPAINPGADEVCNGIDDNCDGDVDNGGLEMCPQGVCSGGSCLTECTDGQCPSGFVCDDRICKPEPTTGPECTPSTMPCVCPEGMTCDRGVCEGTCVSDTQCVTGETCDGGTCEQICVDGTICDSGETCVESVCRTSCTSDADCQPGANICGVDDTICVEGVCRASCIPRLNDCDQDEVCETTNGTSFCSSPTCESDTNCGPGKTCQHGLCLPDPDACVSDNDCAAGQLCVTSTCQDSQGNLGDPCSQNAHCNSGVCTSGTCSDNSTNPGQPGDPCSQNSQCASGVCTSGTCAGGSGDPCASDGDCSLDEVCDQGNCSQDRCDTDTDCGEGYRCFSGVCHRQCGDDSECGPGGVCRDSVCRHSCADGHRCPPGQRCAAGVCHSGPPHTAIYAQGGCSCRTLQAHTGWNYATWLLTALMLLAAAGARSHRRRS